MKNRIYLHIPKFDELDYRQKLLSQPETMGYNKGYDLNFDGYDNQTGCMEFPEKRWQEWYNFFVNAYPNRYYAYIANIETKDFIGEVNFHKNEQKNWYDMGIVIEHKYRGQGYSAEALKLLLQVAFEQYGVNAIHNDFETDRIAAVKIHYLVGFKKMKVEDNIVHFLITKEEYDKR